MSSIAGSVKKRSRADIVTPAEFSGSNALQKYDQGVYVNDMSKLLDPATVYFRPNNDFLKIKNGTPVPMTYGSFDDVETPISLGTGSLVTFSDKSSQGSNKKTGYNIAPSHYLLDYDFGQADPYQDGAPFDENLVPIVSGNVSSIDVIETDPEALIVPFAVVNPADQISTDGLIDVFNTRKVILRNLEVPFSTKGVRADLQFEDAYRRSFLMEDQTELLFSRAKEGSEDYRGTDAYVDAGDEFGLNDIFGIDSSLLALGYKSPEGYVEPPDEVLSPYKERTDRDLIVEKLELLNDADMAAVVLALTGSEYFPTHEFLSRNHISLSRGFDYDIGDSRIDSRAFGGLIK